MWLLEAAAAVYLINVIFAPLERWLNPPSQPIEPRRVDWPDWPEGIAAQAVKEWYERSGRGEF
jgi:hypothetical protein